MPRSFRVTATAVRTGFKATLARVRDGAPAVIFNHDRIVGALISPEDYRLLRALRRREDVEDVRDARAALAEVAAHSSIPWDQVKAELGLDPAGESGGGDAVPGAPVSDRVRPRCGEAARRRPRPRSRPARRPDRGAAG